MSNDLKLIIKKGVELQSIGFSLGGFHWTLRLWKRKKKFKNFTQLQIFCYSHLIIGNSENDMNLNSITSKFFRKIEYSS